MNNYDRIKVPSLSYAKRKNQNIRSKPYSYKAGEFALTASFRRKVDNSTIEMVAALVPVFSQKQIANMIGVGVSTVGKIVRIAAYRGLLEVSHVQ